MSEPEIVESVMSINKRRFGSLVSPIVERIPLASFGYLNICQFIGAMNDNIFKLLLIYCFIQIEGVSASNRILSLVGACYVLPFIFLSGVAGTIADRYSKQKVIVITRFIELIVMAIGMLALYFQSKWLAFSSLALLGTHSCIFGPCKMGIIPEIVPKGDISKANGIVTSCTYVAIIIGTFLASFFADITDRNFVLSLGVAFLFSTVSFFSSLLIQKTPPSGSTRTISPWFFSDLMKTLRVIRQEPSLLSAVVGSAFFLFIGSFIQLNMIPFAIHNLHLSDVQGGYLFLLTALGIGGGSLLAGKLSGKTVEFGLVPIGGVGIAICCFLLDFHAESLIVELVLIGIIGIFGGLYLVPLDSYIQVASPKTYRGQVAATANFFGFCGVLLSAAAIYLLSEVLGLSPDKGFTFVGFLTLGMVCIISVSMSGYIIRFFSFFFSYILFPGSLSGKDQIPIDSPSLFFVPHSFLPWALVLIAAQRRRMRLITIESQDTPTLFLKLVRRLVPILEVDSLIELFPAGRNEDLLVHPTNRGTSVAIFCSKKTLNEQVPEFIQTWKSVPSFKPGTYYEIVLPEALPNINIVGSRKILADVVRIA